MFYYFKELGSTIDEAKDPKYGHGDVVVADYQTAGRGQRGRVWSSRPGENLMFSVVMETSFLKADEQFLVLQAVAVALAEVMAEYGIDARIKWPNDMYVGDRKIVGVLIDHTLGTGGMLRRSGAGIGINVGQREFDAWLPNPTSMALETGREFDRREVLERFHWILMGRIEVLKDGGGGAREELRREYHGMMYRLGAAAKYTLPDGTEFEGTIRGVGPGGELMVEEGGVLKKYLFHEVAFVI